jgi:hypothetical protein
MLEAIMISLGLIDTPQALEFLKKMKDHPSVIVRQAVEAFVNNK